jgi:hypothetical protein
MKPDVLHFDHLEQHLIGERVQEKIYSTVINGIKICSAIWCVWNDRKQKWGKWHNSFFFYGEKTHYADESFRNELDKRTSLTIA